MSDNKKIKPLITEEKNLGGLAFLPLLVFLGLYVGAGLIFTLMGVPEPFRQIPRETALMAGVLVGLLMGKRSFSVKTDSFSTACGDPGVMLMVLIFILAGAFAGVAKEMGGVTSTVNLGLTYVPSRFILAGIFLISSFVATAMGTSMGTIAAIGPIAVGLSEITGLDMAICISAVVGGGMFGDNLSVISDTTIAATRGAGCEMKDKFRMNLLIALPAALLAMVVYTIVGGAGAQLEGPFPFELIKVVPYIAVLALAIAGVDVLVVLFGGTVLAGLVGGLTGSMTFVTFAKSVASGIAGMLSIVIVTILMRGLTGLVRDMGGTHWLTTLFNSNVKSRKGAQYSILGITGILDACMANNTIAILIAAPLTKPIAKKFGVAPQRLASLLDIISCVIQGFLPHGGQIMLAVTLTSLSPLTIMGHSYYLVLLLIATVVTIQFELLKTKEEKEGVEFYPELDENGEAIPLGCPIPTAAAE